MNKLEIKNPATNKVIEKLNFTEENDINSKIDNAYKTFLSWRETDAHTRASILKEWSYLINEHREELAKIITLEGGKPLKESRGEIDYARSYIDWYAEEAKRLYGRTIPSNTENKRIITQKSPVGVVGAITPWNFPAAMITRKIAPALAAGCTIICKPAVATPLTTIKLIELAHKAGVPQNAVDYIIASGKDAGRIFTEHRKIAKLTFTGSTPIGKKLIKQSADTVKNITMELGGLAPVIVHKDADIDFAVEQTIAAKFRNAGQTCVCANRIYVHKEIEELFIEKLIAKVNKLNVGNGENSDVDIGPLIDQEGVNKVIDQIKDAQNHGGILSSDLNSLQYLGGNFLKPVVISNVNNDMKVMNEETFGPIAPVMSYTKLDDVIKLANDTEFGLAAYYFTNNYQTGLYLYENLDYGVIGWNDGLPSGAHVPFGGLKESGYGREGGKEGIEPYLETKYLSVGI
ncbi:NAD-dependent succinate-semialdehyde dehydrogenase [Staphylococcus shinii]|jgi:succinate-semialdehyde dehydrogenase/glutarate-semialdehyde dehydrogenase|uniref:NAD-dependent succinate-semialdehyde dehydrogenase n=1 Tax=Staphylococcus shinii TaxID=2912228 RepID=A0A418IHC4_9STAP|nr:NAD-dependent succinate-semialdehyde dehydrogenase [Staphylococcus shinii]MDW8563599.1 NAD-dependent succinate-semialdehyde dehydrogenase [Staphylococcus shinii]MDW8566839.1 NAD-dependent succinate-semialdehyde dehydrogenase [Staphylococcus shinii]RIN01955.1 NAD-dependent succinate-semialdehyde dehydrogenase [Staphylococcus shinii]RIN10209.1 NAD-dependent succinate-semialdehyde dehydrogenase [Staphylococcus shinii]